MTKMIRVHEVGGPEAMRFEDVDLGAPGAGEVRIRHTAVGLNYIDVYFRTGLYPAPSVPFTPGMEAAGEVVAIGDSVTEFAVGDRVAYAAPPLGAYSEERLMPADRIVNIPDGVSDEQAAAMMLKGDDRRVPATPDFSGQGGTNYLVPCSGWGGWSHCLSMGEVVGSDRHRHRG